MIRKQFRPQMLDLRPVPCLAPAVAIGFSGLSRAQTLFTAEFDQISSPDITVLTGRFQPLRCVTVGPAALATDRDLAPWSGHHRWRRASLLPSYHGGLPRTERGDWEWHTALQGRIGRQDKVCPWHEGAERLKAWSYAMGSSQWKPNARPAVQTL